MEGDKAQKRPRAKNKYIIGTDISLLASASTTFQVNIPTWARYLRIVRYETQKMRLSVYDRNQNKDLIKNQSLYENTMNMIPLKAEVFPSGILDITVTNSDGANTLTNNISFEFSDEM